MNSLRSMDSNKSYVTAVVWMEVSNQGDEGEERVHTSSSEAGEFLQMCLGAILGKLLDYRIDQTSSFRGRRVRYRSYCEFEVIIQASMHGRLHGTEARR